MNVSVLRIGHRFVRDDRITTHAALLSRAFGADIIYMTDIDPSIIKTVEKVSDNWGGKEFRIEIVSDWRKLIKKFRSGGGNIVHLTMYGMNIDDNIDDLRQKNNLLIVISAEKAPKDLYYCSDYNIAIGNQPHSEISALAIFLDRLYQGKQLVKEFSDAKLRIIPRLKGKMVIKDEELNK